jgi:hypothetical protein
MLRATATMIPLMLLAGLALADSRQAQFTVAVVVPSRATLTPLAGPTAFTLTAEDVARGYKDLAARYEVRHSDARGYLLRLAPRMGLTRRVEIQGLAAPILLHDTEVEVHQRPGPGVQQLALEFRFVLEPAAVPGAYALPVHVSATPL